MSQKELPMETGVPVKLTAEERDRKARSLLRSMKCIDEYNIDIDKHRKAKKALIDAEEETIKELRRVLEADEQLVAQGDLFVDQHSATRGLAQVAEAAGDVDELIAEQTALMDESDSGIKCDGDHAAPACPSPGCWHRQEPVPIESIPESCPTCGSALRVFQTGAMCSTVECPWVGKLTTAAQEPVEEQPPADAAEVCTAWCADSGGEGQVASEAAKWWREMQPTASLSAAMVSWRAQNGAPFAVTWKLREEIAAAREALIARDLEPSVKADDAPEVASKTPGVLAAEARQAEIDAARADRSTCDHEAVQGRKKPGRGKHLVCPDCNVVLHNCQECDRYETPDDLGACTWDECGKKLCAACMGKHEAAVEGLAHLDQVECEHCHAEVDSDNTALCDNCKGEFCQECAGGHDCQPASDEAGAHA
jgi:hypothetical protein